MKRILLVWAFCLGSVSAAPPDPVLCWNHDGVNLTRFETRIDTGAWTDVALPTAARCQTTYGMTLQTLSSGAHTVTVRACNNLSCDAGVTVNVVKL